MALERVKIFLWALAACGGTRMPCWDDLKKFKKNKKKYLQFVKSCAIMNLALRNRKNKIKHRAIAKR